ncbi:50S ribosomal protein L9 [Candidatus Parcubacteria bacterium]|jgi:large subunit ribosomal protein L9|nr:MAG: 50S ribosomal protein L9 [Candidatus Parcubacteria bacterium]
MKVVFLTSFSTYQAGRVYNVADGFARNYLLPKGLVKLADEHTVKSVLDQQNQKKSLEAKQSAELVHELEKLNGGKISIPAKAAEGGKLYAAVSPEAIGQAIFAKFGFKLPGKLFKQLPSLKTKGQHEIVLQENGKSIKFILEL